MLNRELNIVVMPSGILQTEWVETKENINKSSLLLQEEIFNRFVADAEFIRTYSPEVHLVGRVFFHLVENKDDNYPFAFLATYSTRLNRQGKSKHLPLKHALKEYETDRDKLLELLATVHLAAGQSPFLAHLLDTGELFHPLAWSTEEAYSFLKEVAVFENCGILCRIPNWWQGKP